MAWHWQPLEASVARLWQGSREARLAMVLTVSVMVNTALATAPAHPQQFQWWGFGPKS